MALIPGVPVSDVIVPTDSTDTYPTHDSVYGIGGWREAANNTARNAIPNTRRRRGMVVITVDSGSVWKLNASPWAGDDTDWEQIFVGGGESAGRRNTTITVAPYGGVIGSDGATVVSDYIVQDENNADVEINAALEEASALPGGGTVELLAGTFKISQSVIPLSHTWLKGQGMWGQTIIQGRPGMPAPSAILDNYDELPPENPWSYGMVSDMELDASQMTRDVVSAKCFNSSASYKCMTFNIYAHDSTATGLGMDDYVAGFISHCVVENCGYVDRREIVSLEWSPGVFTIETDQPHGYTGTTLASGTLTASGTPANNDTVTIGPRIYTFKTTLTGEAYEILIGANAAEALDNLKSAVQATAGAGTTYGTGTIRHPSVTATTNTDTTQLFTATSAGDFDEDAPTSIPTSATGSSLSFGAAALQGGVKGSVITVSGNIMADQTPSYYNGRYLVSEILDTTTFTITSQFNATSFNLAVDPGVPTTLGSVSDYIIGHNGIGVASGATEFEQSTIVSDCVCIDNQNNNFLIEADKNVTGPNASYIFTNCISVRAGTCGFLNTGTPNSQFNDCYDYGSPQGYMANSTFQTRTITNATWSAGVATFTVSADHNYSATGAPDAVPKKVEISNMYPEAWNGYYLVQSTPTSTTFTVNIDDDPGTAVMFGSSKYAFHNVWGSTVNDCIFSYNVNWGIRLVTHSDGMMIKDTTVKYAMNRGIQLNSSGTQISGVRVHDSGRQGIYLATGNSNIVPMDRVDISDSMVWNSGKREISSSQNGIEIDPGTGEPIKNVTISNVQCWDDQDVKTQEYGIITREGALENVSITGGSLTENAVAGLLTQGSLSPNAVRAFNVDGVNPVNKRVEMGNISGSTTFDAEQGDHFVATLTGNVTAVMSTNPVNATRMTWVLIQDATGSRTLSLPVNAAAARALTLSTQPDAVDTITWQYDKTNLKWREVCRSLHTPLNTITVANGDNVKALNVTQNDTTNNPVAVDITNAGTSHALRITQNGVTQASTYGLFVDSSAAQVNAPGSRMRLSNASSTQPVLQLSDAGSGGALSIQTGNIKMAAGTNITTAIATGTKIGTATNEKIGFFNATPIIQPTATSDLGTVLSDLGLRAAGTAYPLTTTAAVSLGNTTVKKLVSTVANTENVVALAVTNNDTTNNPETANIVNDGTDMALRITQNGVLGSMKFGLIVDSNTPQVMSSLVRFQNTNASSTQPTLELVAPTGVSALNIFAGDLEFADGSNMRAHTVGGTKIGLATTEKWSMWGQTPIVQPDATTDLGVVLSNIGLRAAGTAYPISTSGTAALGATTITGTLTTSSTVRVNGNALLDSNGNKVVQFTPTASAVSYVDITNAASGGTITLAATASAGTPNFIIKGSGTFALRPTTNGTNSIRLQDSTGSNNALSVDTSNTRVAIGGTTATSTLDVRGSLALPITTKTANYTATVSDYTILVDATAGSVTITLPAVSGITGRVYIVKKIDSTGNTVVIDANASELIDGATTQTLAAQWDSYRIQTDGSAWYRL